MNGYTQKRRGAVEHLRDGRLTLLGYGAHDLLLALADKQTGVWWGSAKALSAICGAGDITERQARHILETLEIGRYIKRFATRRSHGNYPILLNKFEPTCGAYKGLRLNTDKTSDWRAPVFEACQEQGAERGQDEGAERASIREGDVRKEKETKLRGAKPAAPTDPRHQAFVDFAMKTYRAKYGQAPNWSARDDFSRLKALLKGNPNLPLETLILRWKHYLASTEPFIVQIHGSLSYFVQRFDQFSEGPRLERNARNAKIRDFTGTDVVLDDLRAGSGGLASHMVKDALAKRPA